MRLQGGTILEPASSFGTEPYAKSLLQAAVKSWDPLQGDRVVGEVDLAK